MKTSSCALFSLVVGASMVFAAFEPAATMVRGVGMGEREGESAH